MGSAQSTAVLVGARPDAKEKVMIKKILGVLAALIGAILVLALMQPDSFTVQRAIEINAPPEKVFPLVNDFSQWPTWSPWEKRDPAMKRSLSATTAGKGATYAWEGNKDVGQGRMEIVESTAPSRIGIKLDFIAPFEAHNQTTFAFEPKGGTTLVTWTMQGPTPFVSKLFSVFMSMDRMVGKDFEAGLANMKAAAEK